MKIQVKPVNRHYGPLLSDMIKARRAKPLLKGQFTQITQR